jgi:hypothetical protein
MSELRIRLVSPAWRLAAPQPSSEVLIPIGAFAHSVRPGSATRAGAPSYPSSCWRVGRIKAEYDVGTFKPNPIVHNSLHLKYTTRLPRVRDKSGRIF